MGYAEDTRVLGLSREREREEDCQFVEGVSAGCTLGTGWIGTAVRPPRKNLAPQRDPSQLSRVLPAQTHLNRRHVLLTGIDDSSRGIVAPK